MSGESMKNSDFRKAVKVKAPKKKDPLKGKLPREQKEKKKKGKTWKFTPAVKTTKTTQKGNLPRSAVFSLRKEPSKSSKTSEFRADERYGLASQGGPHYSTPEGDTGADKRWEERVGDDKYAVILLCTDKESFLQTYNPLPRNCDIIEITEEDDFTSPRGYEKTKEALKTYKRACLFISMPCVGGLSLIHI